MVLESDKAGVFQNEQSLLAFINQVVHLVEVQLSFQ